MFHWCLYSAYWDSLVVDNNFVAFFFFISTIMSSAVDSSNKVHERNHMAALQSSVPVSRFMFNTARRLSRLFSIFFDMSALKHHLGTFRFYVVVPSVENSLIDHTCSCPTLFQWLHFGGIICQRCFQSYTLEDRPGLCWPDCNHSYMLHSNKFRRFTVLWSFYSCRTSAMVIAAIILWSTFMTEWRRRD